MDDRFDGFIAGLGTATGLRAVFGHWPSSPLGAFTDVMVERPDGHRVLLAPSAAVAEFVAALAPVDPPVRFGFGSTPRTPALTRVTTIVRHRRLLRPRTSLRPRTQVTACASDHGRCGRVRSSVGAAVRGRPVPSAPRGPRDL